MTAIPVWLLDVDGVINAARAGWERAPRRRRVYSADAGIEFVIRFEPQLLREIVKLHESGAVEVRWCSTWCCDADALELKLELPRFGRAFTDPVRDEAAAAAKLRAAQAVLASERALIWTDDIEIGREGAEYDAIRADRRVLAIQPKSSRGLRPADLLKIKEFIHRRSTKRDGITDTELDRWMRDANDDILEVLGRVTDTEASLLRLKRSVARRRPEPDPT